MAALQLQFFPPVRPLAERFGAGFFRAVPECPGVYLMCGQTEGVLYVGKARNLRRRLGYYRSADPERLPRKLRRLLASVQRIHWDECADERAALARERELLLALRPRFNTVGIYPASKLFLRWQPTANGLALGRLGELRSGDKRAALQADAEAAAAWSDWHGPVKGGRFVYAAMLRLLWWTQRHAPGWEEMPRWLRRHKTPSMWEFATDSKHAENLCRELGNFFHGRSPELVEWFVGSAAWRPCFERAWIERDALLLLEYFERFSTDADPDLH